jgi:hypothetical protein
MSCVNLPFGCGGLVVNVDAEAEKGFTPMASRSAFSSLDNMYLHERDLSDLQRWRMQSIVLISP